MKLLLALNDLGKQKYKDSNISVFKGSMNKKVRECKKLTGIQIKVGKAGHFSYNGSFNSGDVAASKAVEVIVLLLLLLLLLLTRRCIKVVHELWVVRGPGDNLVKR